MVIASAFRWGSPPSIMATMLYGRYTVLAAIGRRTVSVFFN